MIALARDRDLNFLEPTSILLRIHENQLHTKPDNFFYGDIDTSYLPPADIKKYLYNEAQQQNSKEKKPSDIYNYDPIVHKSLV